MARSVLSGPLFFWDRVMGVTLPGQRQRPWRHCQGHAFGKRYAIGQVSPVPMLVEQRTGFVELPRAPSCVVMSAGMGVRCVQECCARMSAGMLVRRVDDAWRTTNTGEPDSVNGLLSRNINRFT